AERDGRNDQADHHREERSDAAPGAVRYELVASPESRVASEGGRKRPPSSFSFPVTAPRGLICIPDADRSFRWNRGSRPEHAAVQGRGAVSGNLSLFAVFRHFTEPLDE